MVSSSKRTLPHRRNSSRWSPLLPLLAAFALLAPRTSAGNDILRSLVPQLTTPLVTHTSEHILMYGSLRGLPGDVLDERMKAGIPLTIAFHLELREAQPRWLDTKLASREIVRTATFDGLRQEYHLTYRDTERSWEQTTKSYPELQRLMSEIEGEIVGPFSLLEPGKRYYIRAQSRLKTEKMTFPLNYLFFFVAQGWTKSKWATSSHFSISRENEP